MPRAIPAPAVPAARDSLLGADHPLHDLLAAAMGRFTVDHLVNETPESFERRIRAMLANENGGAGCFVDPARQRDQSVRFAWGHRHDFGSFALEGAMLDRHMAVLAGFMHDLAELPTDLTGKRVLDIGCWTGGTSLILAALGAQVVAVEEVRMYAETVEFLAHAFGIDAISVLPCSLYELPERGIDDSFDFVLYSGVLYHVTDPVLSLRICFNCLADGGRCLVESAATGAEGSEVAYHGASRFWNGSEADRNRRGWNWFVPSLQAAGLMMADVGFESVRVIQPRRGRLIASGTRVGHRDMLRAGLSRPDIR